MELDLFKRVRIADWTRIVRLS